MKKKVSNADINKLNWRFNHMIVVWKQDIWATFFRLHFSNKRSEPLFCGYIFRTSDLSNFFVVTFFEQAIWATFFVVTYVIKLPGQVFVTVSCFPVIFVRVPCFPVIFVYICHRCQVATMMSSRFCHPWRVPTTWTQEHVG